MTRARPDHAHQPPDQPPRTIADPLRRWLRGLNEPATWLGLVLLPVLILVVLVPLMRLGALTFADGEGLTRWTEVLSGRLSRNLFWTPVRNTVGVGLVVGAGSTILGGLLAWLVMMTDIPARKTLGLLASIPFILPSFAMALAWQTMFRNARVGGRTGIVEEMGVTVPDWLAWGFLPVSTTLTAHYYSLSFVLIAAALASVNSDLLEAGQMAGAGRLRVAAGIALPVVLPAVISGALLGFAQGVSNFASPALLGVPVRFHTLSTRLYGSLRTGQTERGYVIALLLILLAALILWGSSRIVNRRRSYATITGKGGRRQRVNLGPWRWPAFGLAMVVCTGTTIVPGMVLLGSSFAQRTGSITSGLTTHYWIGSSDPALARGLPGILRNPTVFDAATNTLVLGLTVAAIATTFGLLAGYVMARCNAPLIRGPVSSLSYLPFLIPGIAMGAAYIALFGRPFGPFPPLYGTLALLVIAGAASTLPFAAQAGRSAVTQVSHELEEAAVMVGAPFHRRLVSIVIPLTARGLSAGAVLVFVKMVRDLSLVVLLATPATTVLSVVIYQYASEEFLQLANAITVVLAAISIGATMLARRLEGAAQPWDNT